MISDALCIEPYLDEEGRTCYYIVRHNGDIESRTESDLLMRSVTSKEEFKEIMKFREHILWRPPATLDAYSVCKKDLPEIADRIIRYLGKYVWLPNTRDYFLLASWAVFSYFREWFRFSPLLVLDGKTQAGKSTLMNAMSRICYRGFVASNYSGAVIPRIIKHTNATICLDEALDNLNSERSGDIQNLMKSVVDPTQRYTRAVPKTRDGIEVIPVYTSMIVSVKGADLAEDVCNRGIRIQMQGKPKGEKLSNFYWVDRLEKGEDTDPATIARDLCNLRIRTLIGKITEPDKELNLAFEFEKTMADLQTQTASGNYRYGQRYNVFPAPEITNRLFNIASSLLPVAGLSGIGTEVIERILAEEANYSEAVFNSEESQVFACVVECVIGEHEKRAIKGEKIAGASFEHLVKQVTTKAIAERLNRNLAEEGNLVRNETVPTRHVARIIKTLGLSYTMGRGSGGRASALDPTDAGFQRTFFAHLSDFTPEYEKFFDLDSFRKVNKVK